MKASWEFYGGEYTWEGFFFSFSLFSLPALLLKSASLVLLIFVWGEMRNDNPTRFVGEGLSRDLCVLGLGSGNPTVFWGGGGKKEMGELNFWFMGEGRK